ncbi:MAG: hypothetical protein HY289_04045 [Planctomycetes bacterium]|nr:hypothetical protein [Planctomycetota bacterium]
MAVNVKARKALDLKKLRLPASPVVKKIEVEDYTDTSGEDALRVLVIIDEATDLDHINGRDVGDLRMTILKTLRKHGVTLFPYIFFAKPSELAETDDDE